MAATAFNKQWAGGLVAVALLATSGSASASIVLPAPEELPRNTVVVVSHVGTGLGRITRAEFQRALTQSAAEKGRSTTPKPGGNGYEKLKDTAMGELLDRAWIEGQAAEMGIKVTSGQVSRQLTRLKKQAFKSEAAYHKFLKESHFSRREVRERVRVQLLASGSKKRSKRAPGTNPRCVRRSWSSSPNTQSGGEPGPYVPRNSQPFDAPMDRSLPMAVPRPQPEALNRGF